MYSDSSGTLASLIQMSVFSHRGHTHQGRQCPNQLPTHACMSHAEETSESTAQQVWWGSPRTTVAVWSAATCCTMPDLPSASNTWRPDQTCDSAADGRKVVSLSDRVCFTAHCDQPPLMIALHRHAAAG